MSLLSEPLLLETIAIRDGIPQRLDLHQNRVDRSRRDLLGMSNECSLAEAIDLPHDMQHGFVKCRVLYDDKIHRIDYQLYRAKPVEGIVLAKVSDIDYRYKYTDRSIFRLLEEKAPGKVVIVEKGGFITDATYANLALYDGERWVTPSLYLLNGVMRQWLLSSGMIEERSVRIEDLPNYTLLKLINAMLELGESPAIPLSNVSYI